VSLGGDNSGSIASADRLGALLLFAFCFAYGLLTQNIQLLPGSDDIAFDARTMPTFLAVLGCVLASLLFLKPASSKAVNLRHIRWLRLIAFLVLMSLFGIAIRPLGFVLATTLFLAISFGLLGERRRVRLIVIPALVATGFWAIMDVALGVYVNPLPEFPAG